MTTRKHERHLRLLSQGYAAGQLPPTHAANAPQGE